MPRYALRPVSKDYICYYYNPYLSKQEWPKEGYVEALYWDEEEGGDLYGFLNGQGDMRYSTDYLIPNSCYLVVEINDREKIINLGKYSFFLLMS